MPTTAIASEGPIKITKQTIESGWKRRAKSSRLVIRDAECRGLSLVVNPTGMAWRFEYKPRGVDPSTGRRWPSQAVTIGTPESHSPDGAREAAGALKGRAKAGEDLAGVRRAAITEASRQRALTVGKLVDAYEIALPTRPKLRGTGPLSSASVQQEIALVRRSVGMMDLGLVCIGLVSVEHIQRLLSAEATRPATARKLFGSMSRFFDWAQAERYVTVNPCMMLSKARRPKAVPARPNYLHLDELARLWEAADTLEPVVCQFIRFMIAVPCRLREATRLEWKHLDLERAVWTIPGPLSKNREQHRIHLHDLALAPLKSALWENGQPATGLVFPSPRAARPLETFTAMKRALTAATGCSGWTFHDFRRSFASACAENGVSETVADAVLSHRQSATRGGVLGVYQRSSRWPEQVAAMNTWGDLLSSAISGIDPGRNVVSFSNRRRASA